MWYWMVHVKEGIRHNRKWIRLTKESRTTHSHAQNTLAHGRHTDNRYTTRTNIKYAKQSHGAVFIATTIAAAAAAASCALITLLCRHLNLFSLCMSRQVCVSLFSSVFFEESFTKNTKLECEWIPFRFLCLLFLSNRTIDRLDCYFLNRENFFAPLFIVRFLFQHRCVCSIAIAVWNIRIPECRE